MTVYTDSWTEYIDLTPTVDIYQLVTNFTVTENFSLHPDTITGWPHALTDGVTIGDTLLQNFGATLTEGVTSSDLMVVNAIFRDVTTEAALLSDTNSLASLFTLLETINLTEVVSLIRTLSIIDALQLTDVMVPSAIFGMTSTERVAMHDLLARFFSGDITDSFTASDTLVNLLTMPQTLAETVQVSESATQVMVFRVVVPDTISLDDIDLQKMIFQPTVTEGVEIIAGYIGPNGQFTTWAINTEIGAVTEYTNYEFNSFAQIGNRYYGASAAGLYALDGDDDEGVDIIAQIKSGFMQFGGSRFASIKTAYLGMRGSGDFVLKLETGDGKTYHYAVNGKDMETTRVRFGKGLRARYFAFELISTGQDFDLDDIEFIPLVAQRRV